MTVQWLGPHLATRLRASALAAMLLSGAAATCAASPFSDAAERLNGEWRNDGFVLRVDAKRAQASTAADRPFEWQRFLVKEVAGNEVTFTIGDQLFEAIVDADTLVLSGTEFRGEQVLFRGIPDQPDAGAEGAGLRGSSE
jgi:hypothetical protein